MGADGSDQADSPGPAQPDAPDNNGGREARIAQLKSWGGLRPSSQAALRCKDVRFQKWCSCFGEDATAAYIRTTLGIESRSELDQDDRKRQAMGAA